MVVDKFTQLNAISKATGKQVWEPKYSTEEVYVACWKIDKSKLDIKLEFSEVSPTNEWAGVWFISRKKAVSFKKRFDNNGMWCYVIPLSALERLEISERSDLEWK